MRKTIIDQIECTQSGVIQVRFGKQVLDGGEVISHLYHRTVINPGTDVDDQISAVNIDLANQKPAYPPVELADVERLKRIVATEHTPEAVAAWKSQQKRQS